jgi:hypothetical protein
VTSAILLQGKLSRAAVWIVEAAKVTPPQHRCKNEAAALSRFLSVA